MCTVKKVYQKCNTCGTKRWLKDDPTRCEMWEHEWTMAPEGAKRELVRCPKGVRENKDEEIIRDVPNWRCHVCEPRFTR